MSSRGWSWVRALVGVVVLGYVVWWLGSGPFLAGLARTSAAGLLVAAAVTVLTTVASAWRWQLVARGLGVGLPLRAAVGAYYRSMVLNATLPGGVLGDVQRAVAGRSVLGGLGRSARTVGWERAAGQVVLAVLAVLALVVLPTPLRVVLGPAAMVALVVVAGAWALHRVVGPAALLRWVWADARRTVLAGGLGPRIAVASVLAAAGHVAVFLLAARLAGVGVTSSLVPVALVVLASAAVPFNVAGWGPREGVSAWAFAAVGLGAAAGATVSVVYGVMAMTATLPGAVLLAADRFRRRTPAAPVVPEKVLHG